MSGGREDEPTHGSALDPTRDPALARLRRYAHLMDAAVRIPGTSIRVGLDSLLGLVPGGGDVAGAALSVAVIVAAARRGAPTSVLGRMTWNVVVDTVVGTVPLLGDLVDVGWKANLRNVRLLEEHLAEPAPTRRRSRGTTVAVAFGLGLVLVLLAVGAWVVVRALVLAIT